MPLSQVGAQTPATFWKGIFKACRDADGVMKQSCGLHRGTALPTAMGRRAEIVGSEPSLVPVISDRAATGLPPHLRTMLGTTVSMGGSSCT